MANLGQILEELAIAVGNMPTSRDPSKVFIQHRTNEPFESTPIAGADGFHITHEALQKTTAFGTHRIAEFSAILVVTIGHGSCEIEANRAIWVARDVERLSGFIENRIWSSQGIVAVFFDSENTIKENPMWWRTELRFRILYSGPVEELT